VIARLRGTVAEHQGDQLVLDVQGVGYLVALPTGRASAHTPGDNVQLSIRTVVREDDIALYGFATGDERQAFDHLCAITGIGPKLALAILGHLDLNDLGRAIDSDDLGRLSKVPGVGRKTASRLCLELKGKLAVTFVPTGAVAATRVTPPDDTLPLALARLDYKKSEIDMALSHPDVPRYGDASVEDRLRASLRVLARPL
jgi:holliday junction DNA helicase RuvA